MKPINILATNIRPFFFQSILVLSVCVVLGYSRVADADPLAVPVLNAASIGPNEIDLSWQSIPGAVTYTIRRSRDDLNWDIIATTVHDTSFKDTVGSDPVLPRPASLYYYEMKAVGQQSESDWSTAASAVTALNGVVATPHFWRNRIYWPASPIYPKYTVSRSTNSAGPFVVLTPTPIAINVFDDTTAEGGKTYFYRVAVNVLSPRLNSAPSVSVSAKTFAGILLGATIPYSQGSPYEADTLLMRARTVSTTADVYGSPIPVLYQHWREAWPNDSIDLETPIPNGNYMLTLKFAEIGKAKAGQRVFDIVVNGSVISRRYDIQRISGSPNLATDLRLQAKVTNGNLSIMLLPSKGTVYGPALNAIFLAPSTTR